MTPLRRTWWVNGVALAGTVAGTGPLVVLAHGFPDLSTTWRHQLPALVAAGYRVLAPDMRGYGRSSRPDEIAAYTAREVGLDLVSLLDEEGVDHAHFVGHDWGASIVWQLGVEHPERVRSLSGISVPYARPSPVAPTRILQSRWGEEFYQLRFQPVGPPEERLGRDVGHTLAAIFADRYDLIDCGTRLARPQWLLPDAFAAYVDAFSRTGFAGGLNYYRNIDDNWRQLGTAADTTIHRPSLFVTGTTDPVRSFMRLDDSPEAFDELEVLIVHGAGHWVHQQEAGKVNEALLRHLARVEARR